MDDFPALPIQGTYEENEKPAIGHHLPKLGKVSAEQTDRLFYRYSCQMRAEDPYKMRRLLLMRRTSPNPDIPDNPDIPAPKAF